MSETTSSSLDKALAKKEKKFMEEYGSPIPAPEAPTYLRALIYGPTNVGKTITSCSIGKRTLLFACDTNWVSLHNHPDLINRVSVVQNKSVDHFPNLVDAIGNGYPAYQGFDTLVIDTYAQLVERFIDNLTENSLYAGSNGGGKFREKATLINGVTIGGRTELPLAAGPDYNVVRGFYRPILEALGTLPMHIIYICHETDSKNHIANTQNTIRANLPNATYNSLIRRCNIVGRMDATNSGERFIEFKKTSLKDAGAKVANLDGRSLSPEKFVQEVNAWSNV